MKDYITQIKFSGEEKKVNKILDKIEEIFDQTDDRFTEEHDILKLFGIDSKEPANVSGIKVFGIHENTTLEFYTFNSFNSEIMNQIADKYEVNFRLVSFDNSIEMVDYETSYIHKKRIKNKFKM